MTLKKINNLNIRPIQEGDKPYIIELWYRCSMFDRGGLDAENEFTVAKLLPRSQIFVAVDSGEIVAVVLGALSHTSGWIWDLAVDPSVQRNGIGKAMVRKAENWVRSEGGKRTMLFLQHQSDELHAFYSGLNYYNVTENIMNKSL